MVNTSLQMANSVAQNAEVLRSFKRQSNEDTASDRDSVASTIRRRMTITNGSSGASSTSQLTACRLGRPTVMVPLTADRSGEQGRPIIMVPLGTHGVRPTSVEIFGVTPSAVERLPTSRQLIPPVNRKSRNQRRSDQIARFNSSGIIPRTIVGSGVTTVNNVSGTALPRTVGSGGVTNSGSSATIPRTILGSGVPGGGTTLPPSGVTNSGSSATIPRTILGSEVPGGGTTLSPLGAAETTIRIPTRKSELPKVVGNKSPSPSDTKPSVTSTHFQRVPPKENVWTRVGPGGRTSRQPDSITIQSINDEEMMLLCQRSERFA